MIRTLIVDDEPLARERIRSLLVREPDVEVIGECHDGQDAVAVIRREKPALVFLDVQIPELDGFGVVKSLEDGAMPVTIFVTAYDQYALQAFEVHAVDYLLKPFDEERFRKAVERARRAIGAENGNGFNARLMAMLQDLKPQQGHADRIVVKNAGRLFFLRADEIDWVESSGNYVNLHVGHEAHLLRETMAGIEERLDPTHFIRIHRTAIVKIDQIRELHPLFHGEYEVVLRDGTRLTLSRGYRDRLQSLLGKEV